MDFPDTDGNRSPGAARYGVMPSTVIQDFAYDRVSAALDVSFVTGRRYRYFLVPAHIARGLAEALSKGRYFNACIRGLYPFAEVTPAAKGARSVTSPRTGSRPRP